MKLNVLTGLIILGMVFLNATLLAHSDDWKTATANNGKVTVKSNVAQRTDENGKSVQLIEYVSTTTARVSMANCIALIKDVSKHKDFLDEEVSDEIKKLSPNEWLIYYYFNAPWPMSDADCVTKMTLTEDAVKKTAHFSLTASPASYEKKEVSRMTYYNVTYSFRDLGNGNVEITSTAKVTPVVQAPDWLVRSFFPDGPADVLRRIVELSNGTL